METTTKTPKTKTTKKRILELLTAAKVATICFNGLKTDKEVAQARQDLTQRIRGQIIEHNIKNPGDRVEMTVKGDKIDVSNGQFVFLPKYPRTGDVVVRSAEFSIDGVYFKKTDIMSGTFEINGNLASFRSKSGNIVQFTV